MSFTFPWVKPQARKRSLPNSSSPTLAETRGQGSTSDSQKARKSLAVVGKFLSYYRPHLPLLMADLACAVLVAATALALPLCANYVTTILIKLR
jgi:ATP-binding cassette subfamily B protein